MACLVPAFSFYRYLRNGIDGLYAPCETLVITLDSNEMAQYRVLVFCPDCVRTHPVRATFLLDDGPIEKATVADNYKDKPLPLKLVKLLKSDILCPELAKSVTLADPDKVYLVPVD